MLARDSCSYYRMLILFFFFFFFQAEDGIRDVAVTGVQTCALPICSRRFRARSSSSRTTATSSTVWPRRSSKSFAVPSPVTSATTTTTSPPRHAPRPTRRRARGRGEARPLGTPLAPSLPPPPPPYATPARREHPERSQSGARWRERCA